MPKEEKDFSYTVGDIDEVVDERGNMAVMLRKLAWGKGAEKLEIRKWFMEANGEKASKGVTFLTEEGPHNLVKIMAEKGFGHTEEVIKAISTRDDFDKSLINVIGEGKVKQAKKAAPDSASYYDPKKALLD